MAEKITPPDNYLQRFQDPIWKKLKLDYPKALSLVEGQRNGHAFTILELRHRSAWLFTDEKSEQTSLIFIMALPDPSKRWKTTWQPEGVRVWVDEGYVYLTRLAQRTPVKEWNQLLAQTQQVLETLAEVPADQQAAHQDAPYENTNDARLILFWVIVAGLLPGLEWSLGLSYVGALLKSGFIRECASGQAWAQVGFGRDAWVFALALCLPLLGHIRGGFTITRFQGRRGLGWRLAVDGVLTLALAVGGLEVAMRHAPSAGNLADGTVISCYSNVPNKHVDAQP